MGYEVLARKWRPQQFDDVVGQDHVTQTLRNAIESQRLAHAYLFVGPRGIGKTSLARIFAKALNCAEGPTSTPCGKCDSCKEIAAGNNLDVIEIDGASNNGVDKVRELRDAVQYAPTRGPYKIYIIDEVHMLTQGAFNALLKTLEEPPEHVKFIFATTEPDKVLATIISRCQRFDLRRIPTTLIMERLRLIANDEKVEIADDALLAIARGAEGGLRDAESALDQLISFCGNKISEDNVLAVFGLVSNTVISDIAEWIISGNIQSLLQIIAELDNAGRDLRRLVVELTGYFRNLLVCKHVSNPEQGLDLPESQVAALKEQAQKTDSGRLVRVIELLIQAEGRMRVALSGRTMLETTLIRCARAATVVTLEEILKKLSELSIDGGENPPKKVDAGAAPAVVTNKEPDVVAEKQKSEYVAREDSVVPVDNNDELEKLLDNWDYIIDRISKIVPLMRSSIIDTKPVAVEEARVVVGVDREFPEELENLKNHHNQAIIKRVISDFLKRKVVVEYQEITVEHSALADNNKKAEKKRKNVESSEARNVLAKWADNPVVREAMEMFEGCLIECKV